MKSLTEMVVDIGDRYGSIHGIIGDVIPTLHWPLNQGFSGYIYGISHKSFIFEHERTQVPPEVIPIGFASTYWLGSPLFSQVKIIGIVVFQMHDASDAITKEDEYTLNSICPYRASAISHTELLSRLLTP